MEMDAGVALTATGMAMGGCGAGGLGARCLVDLVGAGGWGSAASCSLVVTVVSCRKIITFAVDNLNVTVVLKYSLYLI